MSIDTTALTEAYYKSLRNADLTALVELYAEDAEVVRYDGSAKGRDEIRSFFESWLARYGSFSLVSVDNVRQVDDVALWDATVDTQLGVLLTYDVAILEADALIRRHVPSVRGYWGGRQ